MSRFFWGPALPRESSSESSIVPAPAAAPSVQQTDRRERGRRFHGSAEHSRAGITNADMVRSGLVFALARREVTSDYQRFQNLVIRFGLDALPERPVGCRTC